MEPDQVRSAITRLSPDERAALERRLLAEVRPGFPSHTIPRRPDQSISPLSPAQERLWALSRIRPADPVYNIEAVWRLRGHLDVPALVAALEVLVARHETLRSRFTTEAGRPVLTFRSESDFVVDHVDLSARAGERDVLDKTIARLASAPFDLGADFLFRAAIVEMGKHDHVLVVTAHHIVCDGWSIGVIATELEEAYASLRNGSELSLPALDVTYADVAAWQIANQAGRRDLEYWATRLAEGIEPLQLPFARRRAPAGGMGGATFPFEIDANLTARTLAFARTHRVTPFVVLLTAYQATLNRVTHQETLVLCTPVAGRDRVETEQLIGYFNNLLALVTDLGGDPSLAEIVRRAAATVTEASDHSAAIFQEVAALDAVATTPLTRGLFVLQDSQAPRPDLPDLDVEVVRHDSDTSDFELAMFLRPSDGELRGAVAFRTALFARTDVRSIVAAFTSTLEMLITQPDLRLSELTSLSRSDSAITGAPEQRSPGSLLEVRLLRVWERVFRRPVAVNDDFFDLGGHSLLAAQLIAEIEGEFGLQPLSLSTLIEAPTVGRFAKMLGDGDRDRSWESLVPIKPDGDRPPLFFVHAHGGNVIGYRDLARHLSPRQPLYGLQAPRSTDEHHPRRRIEHMAKSYIEEIGTVQPEGPYLIGGWCLGGDVAFEMGQQLRRAGAEVALVLMVDNPRPDHLETSARAGLGHHLDRLLTRLEMEWSNFVETPPGQRRRFLFERAERLARRRLVTIESWVSDSAGQLPFGFRHSDAFRESQVAALHEKAYESYTPEPYDGAVAIFRAERQPRGRAIDPTLGWSPYLRGALVDHALPGHRIGMLSEPRVGQSAGILEEAIVTALSRGGDSG